MADTDSVIDLRSDTVTKPTDGALSAWRCLARAQGRGIHALLTHARGAAPRCSLPSPRAAATLDVLFKCVRVCWLTALLLVCVARRAEMRAAMAAAEVGDDVLRDDPTVKRLEQEAAELFGKEAALFTPSGTMANLIAVSVHCRQWGSEFIVGADAHIYFYEGGGSAAVGGAHPRPLPNRPDGTIDIADIEGAIRSDDPHFPVTRLVCLESSHNRCGGVAVPLAHVDAVGRLCRTRGLKLHIDGVRRTRSAALPAALAPPDGPLAATWRRRAS